MDVEKLSNTTTTNKKQHHFVLVHGACHGAWCWYKLAALLESAGHSVTALDMTACGIDTRTLDDVHSVRDYYRPLMDYFYSLSLPPSDKRVVLVGHSFGGVGVSMAMESFPEKIAIAVYAAAMMPSHSFPVADIFDEYHRRNPSDSMLDSKFSFDQGPDKPPTSVVFGPTALSSKFYQNCSPADVKLANLLIRPSRAFTKETAEDIGFTEERFGSVARAYVVCKDDRAVAEDFQRLLIERTPPDEVEEISGADHMVMLSKPQELFNYLMLVAERYD